MTKPYNRVSLTARLRQLGLTALLVGAASAAHAQALPYTTANITNFVNPAGYTDLGTTGNPIPTANFDDASSAAIPLGFNFVFNGVTYSDFYLNTNGFLRLGAAPVSSFFTAGAQDVATAGPLATVGSTNIISPFNTDLEAGTGTPEYRVATTGSGSSHVTTIQWKNVSDKARTGIAKQYANFNFQVKLYETTNTIEFVYGVATVSANPTNANFTSVGIKGLGQATNQVITVVKASNIPWAQTTFNQGLYPASSNGVNIRSMAIIPGGQVVPEPGRTFSFAIPVTNDANVQNVYGFDKLAVPAGQPVVIQARIRNSGTGALSNLVATVTVAGANTASATQVVATLAAGANVVVSFPGVAVPAAGNNTVTVSVPNDGNNSNNSVSMGMITNPTTTSLITPNSPAVSGIGGGGSDQYYGAKITLAAPQTVTAVNAYIGDATPSGTQISTVGQTLYGVVIEAATGTLLARSANFVVTATSVDQIHSFQITSPPTLPAGDVIVGMAQIVDPAAGGTFFPMGVQTEAPNRPNTFYNGTTAGGTPSPALTIVALSNYKYMLEGVFGAPATCATPNNITVGTITQTSASVTFTGPNNGTGYQIVYVPQGTTPTASSPTTPVFTTSPYTLTGLTAGTAYDIYVRAICGPTDQSNLAGPLFFSTPCAPPIITTHKCTYSYIRNL